MRQSNRTLNEGLEKNDLKRLVHPELHIDEFKSKMGRDEDIVVLSFKVTGKEPAEDLVNFLEKGYDWVIDADVSSGELDDGDFIVFVECDREPAAAKNIVEMMGDVMNLTDHELESWSMQFRSDPEEFPITVENIRQKLPLTRDSYIERFGKKDIDQLKTAAGVKVDTKAPKNDFTESLRALAGIL